MAVERTDAARNRARVLAAAQELFATRGADQVTMDDIAQAAGVGRATLYRRYPDRASIAVALLDEHERALQARMLSGPPPLGPGAPPAERLTAFYAALVDLLEQHVHLVLGTEIGQSRYRTGAYGFWRAHVLSLLREAGTPRPEVLADVLLAPLAPDLYRYQREVLEHPPAQIRETLGDLARRVL
ncbi:TetR/AcrR family transcriptional regulator [Dactylosporangium siamense]|uniref:TetR family transcriptional regulator n=1 Tax=Dactylosporangium siamense TaxID=685454 RepID=A0A919PL11_9ACTN|nr:TetR/AcrR family transcriptional regulator [Dactylosporangium siamense]GIG45709.1 TetR family transcriptional regulator [Dactylosporangium siamense]